MANVRLALAASSRRRLHRRRRPLARPRDRGQHRALRPAGPDHPAHAAGREAARAGPAPPRGRPRRLQLRRRRPHLLASRLSWPSATADGAVLRGLTGQSSSPRASSATTAARWSSVGAGCRQLLRRPRRRRRARPAAHRPTTTGPQRPPPSPCSSTTSGGPASPASREIVGRTIRLNGTPFTVIGVAAPGFDRHRQRRPPTNLWVPVTMKPTITPTWDDLDNERSAWFYLFGRLKPGVSIEQAQASLNVLYRQRQEEELKGEYFQQLPGQARALPASRPSRSSRRRAASPTCATRSSRR